MSTGPFHYYAPDHKSGDGPKTFLSATLPADTHVLRLFDFDEYDNASRDPLSFKPSPLPHETIASGRFDGTLDSPVGVIYVATPHDDATVVVWELLTRHMEHKSYDEGIIIDAKDIEQYAFLELRLLENLTLCSIENQSGASHYNASIIALQCSDRDVTQGWGKFIRRHTPDIDGLAYTSARFGDGSHGTPYVIFDPPRGPVAFEAVGAPKRITGPIERIMLEEALLGSKVSILW